MQYVDPWRISPRTSLNVRKAELGRTVATLESAIERLHARIDGMERTLYAAMDELEELGIQDLDEEWY